MCSCSACAVLNVSRIWESRADSAKLWHVHPFFSEVFFKVCQLLDNGVLASFCMVLWSLWNRRNTKVLDGLQKDYSQALAMAYKVMQSWCHARPAHNRDNMRQ